MVKKLIGVTFKKAMEQHIPKGHVLHSVINNHVTKLSYCTMPNMESRIGSHNNKIQTKNEPKPDLFACTCPNTKKGKKYSCVWNGKCKKEGLVYKCTGYDENGQEVWNYVGLTGGNIKDRISTHYNTFKDPEKETNTKLSEQMWEDSRKHIKRELKWEKLAMAKPRAPNNKRCNLCCKEALFIMRRDAKSINCRLELGGYCPHRRKHLLSHIESNKEVLKQKAQEKKRKKPKIKGTTKPSLSEKVPYKIK